MGIACSRFRGCFRVHDLSGEVATLFQPTPTPVSHHAGSNKGLFGSTMLQTRRGRLLLCFIYLSILGSLFYLFRKHQPQRNVKSIPLAQHVSRPTYEYTSLYRTNAEHAFEDTLNAQLLTLEYIIRNSLSNNEQSLTANRTIWQITTPKYSDSYSPWISQWRGNNKDWQYHLYTSPPIELLSLFKDIPEISAAYGSFPGIREDLLRYILLWYHGGFYAEINT